MIDLACPTCALLKALLTSVGVEPQLSSGIAYSPVVQQVEQTVKRKARKKVSKYHREFGKQLKKLKKKHPRTKVQNLMKKAHSATKKALK